MQGVQPKAKATPRNRAPAGPGRTRSSSGRPSCISRGAGTSPITIRPSTTMRIPAARSSQSRGAPVSSEPADAAAQPSAVKTTAKPSTNSVAASTVRPRPALTPDMKPR